MSKTHISSVLRRLVRERSQGCCEYCLIPEIATFAPHEIDHIVAEKHGDSPDKRGKYLPCTFWAQALRPYKDTNNVIVGAYGIRP